MRVAFVGLGVMGFPMAGHLAAKGHEVTRRLVLFELGKRPLQLGGGLVFAVVDLALCQRLGRLLSPYLEDRLEVFRYLTHRGCRHVREDVALEVNDAPLPLGAGQLTSHRGLYPLVALDPPYAERAILAPLSGLAPWLAPFVGAGFAPEDQDRLAMLMRIILLQPVLLLVLVALCGRERLFLSGSPSLLRARLMVAVETSVPCSS